eukprot:1184890-Prorocentrum_minimum.AAC.2
MLYPRVLYRVASRPQNRRAPCSYTCERRDQQQTSSQQRVFKSFYRWRYVETFAGWGPSRGPDPAGGYFSKRPPRALAKIRVIIKPYGRVQARTIQSYFVKR